MSKRSQWKKRANVIYIFIAIVTSLLLLLFTLWYTQTLFNTFDSDETYVIEGKVNETYTQNDSGKKQRYLIVDEKDDSSKLVSVNEQQFQTYNKGSKVKLKIDRAKNDEVVVDLKKHKDINSKDENGSFLEKLKLK